MSISGSTKHNSKPCLAYQTAGWLNYEEEYLRTRLHNAKKEGWTRVKAKVGSQNHEDDARRLAVCREVLGPG